MAVEVFVDQIEGARWEGTNDVPIRISRLFKIFGLEAGVGDKIFRQALDLEQIPKAGDVHPTEAGIYVKRHLPAPLGARSCQIEIVYEKPGGQLQPPPDGSARISGGTNTVEIETQVDRDGEAIIVEHEGRKQGGVIHPTESQDALNYERIEQSAAPGTITRAYVNRLNDLPWQADPRGMWKCIDITFEPENMKTTPHPSWRYKYAFQRTTDEAGWQPQACYIDPETGQPPAGLVEGIGYLTVPWYLYVDFNQLGL